MSSPSDAGTAVIEPQPDGSYKFSYTPTNGGTATSQSAPTADVVDGHLLGWSVTSPDGLHGWSTSTPRSPTDPYDQSLIAAHGPGPLPSRISVPVPLLGGGAGPAGGPASRLTAPSVARTTSPSLPMSNSLQSPMPTSGTPMGYGGLRQFLQQLHPENLQVLRAMLGGSY